MGEADKVHVVKACGYYSGTFRDAAVWYSSIEKETTALLLAINNFKGLMGMVPETFLVTDAQALLWALRFQNSGLTKLEKLCIKLLSLPYRIIISHLRGSVHPADNGTRLFKVPEPQVRLTEAKRAIIVRSPFQLGAIVTPQDILQELQKDPSIVSIPSKPSSTPSPLPSPPDLKKFPLVANIHAASLATLHNELAQELSLSNVMAAQRKDPKWKDIISKLEHGQEIQGYTMRNGILHKERSTSNNSEKRAFLIVLPEPLDIISIASFHVDNHAGQHTIEKMVSTNYYFPELRKKVSGFTKACALCTRFKSSNQRTVALGSAPLPTQKAEHWHLDLVSGLPSVGGKDAYLSLLEPFSGFRLAVICRSSLTARGVADILKEHVISVFGPPKHLTSDGGPQMLKSKEVEQLCSFYNIVAHVGTPYSPRSHGRVEVSNKQITTLTATLSDQYSVPWTAVINWAVFILNKKPRAYFQDLSPFQIMFGIEPAPLPTKTQEPGEDYTKLFQSLHARCDVLIRQARKEMLYNNAKKGGIKKFIPTGTPVYLRVFRLLPKKKSAKSTFLLL